MVQKRLLEAHLLELCSKCPQPCIYCNKVISLSQMESHSIGCNSVYQGEIKKGKYHGKGTYTASDRSSTYRGKNDYIFITLVVN